MNPINGVTNTGAAPAVTQKSKVRAESSPATAVAPKGHMDSLELTDALGQINAEPGFDAAKVEAEFFADNPRHKVNFICSIGYGDPASIFARSPRPNFDAFNRIA